MEVPLPVVAPIEEPVPVVEPAVVSVVLLPGVAMEPEAVLLLVVSLGSVVVDGVVAVVELEVSVVDEVAASSRLPQALRDRAASRARAAHCAVGDLIIRNSFWVSFRYASSAMTAEPAACGSL
jgi:hypothetical protein